MAGSDRWPALPYDEWADTCTTLHLWSQVVGKVRLVSTPWINHSWHATLYPCPRGLTTGAMARGDRYSFSTYYGCAGQSILGCLTGAAYADTGAVNQVMDELYTVMNGPPTYDTSSGIEVEYGH